MQGLISRQEAIDAINKLVDRFERILRDIRETNEDESVCGLCEYDGAFLGQSGDWCNECPGFDRDDCFKLSDRTRKKWIEEIVNTYPDHTADIGKKVSISCAHENDLISRQALCKYAQNQKDKSVTPNDIMRFPSAQPERDIPIKPYETTDTAWGIQNKQAVCPKCDYYLGHVAFLGDYKGKKVTYCETCGQAIDWEGWDFE